MSNQNNAPAYARFALNLAAQFEAQGIPLVPVANPAAKDGLHGNEGWVLFQVQDTGDKVYAKRTRGGDPSVVETTVPFELIPAHLVVEDMRGRNGKIEARVKCDVAELASGLLPVLASRRAGGDKLRASKAPVRRASGTASPASIEASKLKEIAATLASEQASERAAELADEAAMAREAQERDLRQARV